MGSTASGLFAPGAALGHVAPSALLECADTPAHCRLCSCRPVPWVCACLQSPVVGPVYLLAPFLLLALTLSYLPSHSLAIFCFISCMGRKASQCRSEVSKCTACSGPRQSHFLDARTPLVCEDAPQGRADTTPPKFTSPPSSTYHPWFRAFPSVGTRGVAWPLPGRSFGGSGHCWGVWCAVRVTCPCASVPSISTWLQTRLPWVEQTPYGAGALIRAPAVQAEVLGPRGDQEAPVGVYRQDGRAVMPV